MHTRSKKLADAIHTTPDPVSGETDMDDNQSILLTDTSTRHRPPQHEELFAVEGGDSDDDGEVVAGRDGVVQEDPEEEEWDKVVDDEMEEGDGDRQVLMGNIDARRSWADIADLGENPGRRPGRESLSAKAGIILVC
jgi:hypothetical protein